jgi:chemotaxis protein MotB
MSKKKHEEHEEHVNHEAWVIPYADMLTLLMALFLVMWATGQADAAKFEQVASNIRAEFSAANLDGSKGVLEGIGPSPIPQVGDSRPTGGIAPPSPEQLDAAVRALKAQQEIAGAVAGERNTLAQAQSDITNYLQGQGLADQVGFRIEDRGLVVSIVSDKVLFDPGSSTLRPEAVPLMDAVAGGLRGLPNSMIVEGHTDSRPISGGGFGSNWELSTSRATSVLRYLTDQAGFDQRQLSATGYSPPFARLP